jgi:hypothetical protein
MKRPILPLFEPEVAAARLRTMGATVNTAVREVLFAGATLRSMRGSVNEIYGLLNVVDRLDLFKSYMLDGLVCRGDADAGYIAEMWDADEVEAEAGARYLKAHLPADSTLDVVTLDNHFVLGPRGLWAKVKDE